ncbi:hypothetical protein F0562_008395 [Nyssa sinensis]|uniref:PGG domain-containing protein n=1 Tax=Nyssa sinensis TaxID=561372 RepID=A0A5J5A928_9ASTE|nr:hypothetical protein F0562_008395 [Nyssa sinensis]
MAAMDDDKRNMELYRALMEENLREVLKLCNQLPDGPLHVLTIHNDTVLHTAAFSTKLNLICPLLGLLENEFPDYCSKITRRNSVGNTILHEVAAASDSLVEAAKVMLRMAPQLLGMRNNYEETALFRAVRYGRARMFEYLDQQDVFIFFDFWSKTLIEEDKSWKDTNLVEGVDGKTKVFGVIASSLSSASQQQKVAQKEQKPQRKIPRTPLLLATKSGCVYIVEKILRKYPQAVEHVDSEGRTILHLAVMYRQKEIFNMVEKMEIPMRRLTQRSDKDFNSILHMVGKRRKGDVPEKIMRSPALQLQKDLLRFERINKICSENFFKLINSNGQTAEELFAKTNEKLCREAEEWLKRTAESCSIVAVLIATVAFAAAYTIPGGSNGTGAPILLKQPFFFVFTISDVLSLTSTLTSVIVFLSILTSSFRLEDFKFSLPRKLMLGLTFLIFSVLMMMLSFAATIIPMIHNKEQWTKIALSAVALLPVTVFTLSYIPLISSLLETFKYSLKTMGEYFPRYKSGGRCPSWLYKSSKPQTTTSCPTLTISSTSPPAIEPSPCVTVS